MACRVSEEDSVYLRGTAGCRLSKNVHGGLRCTVVLHHFPKASTILQADCMHYHILCRGHEMHKEVALAHENLYAVCTSMLGCVCVPVTSRHDA